MSRESEILSKLDEILIRMDLIAKHLPEEVQAGIEKELLRIEFERVADLAHVDFAPYQQFLRDHPREAMEFMKNSSSMS